MLPTNMTAAAFVATHCADPYAEIVAAYEDARATRDAADAEGDTDAAAAIDAALSHAYMTHNGTTSENASDALCCHIREHEFDGIQADIALDWFRELT